MSETESELEAPTGEGLQRTSMKVSVVKLLTSYKHVGSNKLRTENNSTSGEFC